MDFKKHFNIPSEIIYLNTPGNGLLPKSTLEWRQQRDAEFFDTAGFLRDQQPAFVQEGKKIISSFFDAETSEVFATPSFTWAFNTLLNGFSQDYDFLLLEGDYPSVNYPVISRGFRHHLLDIGENPEENIYNYINTNHPKAFAFSIVQYISGLKINLAFIKKLKNDFPELIIIGDGTQYFGTERFSFKDSGFDVVGGSGYKWLLSGFGNAFLLVKESLQSKLFSVARQQPRPAEAFYTDKSLFAIQFETGQLDTLSYGTMIESIKFIKQLGMEKVEKHINDTLDFAYSEFDTRQLLLPIIKRRENKSPVINLQIAPSLYPQLLEKGVRCFPRGSGIRIGIHLYNDRQDIERLLNIIDQLV